VPCKLDDTTTIPIPLPRFPQQDGYRSEERETRSRHSTWDVVEVSPGDHTFSVTYEVRVGMSGIADPALVRKLLEAGCAVFMFQNKAIATLRDLLGVPAGQGGGPEQGNDQSLLDRAADLLTDAANAALSSLSAFLQVADDVLREYSAAVAVATSSLLVRCLSTSDVEMTPQGKLVRRRSQ
jgi:hypothetical protein